MGLTGNIFLVLAVLNSIITIIVLSIYARNYKATKSAVALSFILFAIVILLQNIADLYFIVILGHTIQDTIGIHNVIVNVIETISLLFLLRLTMK